MQSLHAPIINHTVESAGVDWITGTAKHPLSRSNQMEFARSQHNRFMDSGEAIRQSYRLGYHGWEADGFFYGSREGGSMIVASGATAHSLHRAIFHVSDNISRLDLQVTVDTPIDRPHLALQAYELLRRNPPCDVKVRNVTIIKSHPQGETCNIGRRSSDVYARIYDKAVESGEGAPCSKWRYEVEHKRARAHQFAGYLCGSVFDQVAARELVWDYFNSHGVAPIFTRDSLSETLTPVHRRRNPDVLVWFRDSLSITVGRAIRQHGLPAVLEALSLSNQVVPKPERS